MSWKDKALALVKRFGTPVKFAAKLVVGALRRADRPSSI